MVMLSRLELEYRKYKGFISILPFRWWRGSNSAETGARRESESRVAQL
jgi:hypothetical protein